MKMPDDNLQKSLTVSIIPCLRHPPSSKAIPKSPSLRELLEENTILLPVFHCGMFVCVRVLLLLFLLCVCVCVCVCSECIFVCSCPTQFPNGTTYL